MKQLKFTIEAINSLPPATPGTRDYYMDAKEPELKLVLSVTDTGHKSFQVRRWINGKAVRMVIGKFPDVAIARARKKAKELNQEIAVGGDPYERTRPIRGGMTFGKFFKEEYVPKHAKAFKKTWRQDEDMVRLYLKDFADKRLATIRRRDVHQLHVDIGAKHGHRTANRVLALLRVVFKLAIAWEMLDGDNPATNIRKFPERSRERFLKPEEVPAFFAALAADIVRRASIRAQAKEKGLPVPPEHWETMARDFFLMAVFTGARRGNLLTMKWTDVDLRTATWTIAASETKTSRPYQLVLPSPAVQILEHRRALIPRSTPWVFPSIEGKGENPATNVKDAWRNIRKESGLHDLRIHDLRRTLGSWQAAAGASLPIIGRSLGHASPASTAIYARLDLDPVRQSVETATAALVAASTKKEGKP